MTKRITTAEFIRRANLVHGVGRWDYSKVEYVRGRDKVIIGCPIHGDFEQPAENHMNGRGCKKCGYNALGDQKRHTAEQFIHKAQAAHGVGTYYYSKVEYSTNRKKVLIVCPEHGEFSQPPDSHLSGCGCPECGANKRGKKKRLTREQFIRKAEAVHGVGTYDYSKVEYSKNSEDVCIICPEHGEFFQRPANHLNGGGCRKCSTAKQVARQSHTLESFIEASNKTHEQKYTYEKATYVNNRSEVLITCDLPP